MKSAGVFEDGAVVGAAWAEAVCDVEEQLPVSCSAVAVEVGGVPVISGDPWLCGRCRSLGLPVAPNELQRP